MGDETVRFDERAETDARAAVEWYDKQRPGLGSKFVAALDDTVARIASQPRMYPAIATDVRRALTDRFPYSVYYAVEDDDVLVIAVLHTRRAPEVLEDRLDG